MSCSAIFSKKEFAIISNLRFNSRTKFMLSSVEHENKFYNLGPESPVLFSYVLFLSSSFLYEFL